MKNVPTIGGQSTIGAKPAAPSPITKEAYDALEDSQKIQLAAGSHHAMVKASAKGILDVVNAGIEAGMKMNEIAVILLYADEQEYAMKVIPDLINEKNLLERCKAQKIKVAIFARPVQEFAVSLLGVTGPSGEIGIYDPAAEALATTIEEDRLQVIVFGANRCSTIVLRYDPEKAEQYLASQSEVDAAAPEKA
jgi:hypothetical protein